MKHYNYDVGMKKNSVLQKKDILLSHGACKKLLRISFSTFLELSFCSLGQELLCDTTEKLYKCPVSLEKFSQTSFIMWKVSKCYLQCPSMATLKAPLG